MFHKRNTIKQFVFLLTCFALPALSMAQQPTKDLQLTEAIQLGLEHSKDVKLSNAEIEEAIAGVQDAKNNKLPDLKVSGAYLYLTKPNIDIKFGQKGNNSSSDGSTSDDDKSSTTIPNVHQALYGMVSASLPLYAGGKITNGIKSAEFLASATKLDAQNEQEAVVQNIIQSYYNLYKADATLKLVNENLATAKQRVKDFTNLETNGIIARNDLMKAQLQQSNLELAVQDAENEREITNFNFNLMLGLADSTKILIDSNQVYQNQPVEDLSVLMNMARSNRFDYLAIVEREKAANFATKAVEGNKYPTIALTGGYVAADIPSALTAYNVVNIGVGANWDLASLYKNGAKVRQAKAKESILQVRQEKLDDDIQTQIYKAYNNYTHELKKTDVLQGSISQAEENYRITKNKYDNSLATATELFDADVALLQAKINFENTKADAAIAFNKIYETVGILNKRVHSTQP